MNNRYMFDKWIVTVYKEINSVHGQLGCYMSTKNRKLINPIKF